MSKKLFVVVGVVAVLVLIAALAFPLSNLGTREAPAELMATVDDPDRQAMLRNRSANPSPPNGMLSGARALRRWV